MSKVKFTREYPINASPKILYPYLATASGLAKWFCHAVEVDEDRIYNLIWDNQDHYAEMSNYRPNKSVRYIFLNEQKRSVPDASYIDFYLETSELTQQQYLRVIDYTDEDTSLEELADLWDNLIVTLKEIIGG